MFKETRRITKRTTKEGSIYSFYDRMLNRVRGSLMRLMFALAIAAKVTPTKLASAFDVDKTDHFAKKFDENLVRIADKKLAKLDKVLGIKAK